MCICAVFCCCYLGVFLLFEVFKFISSHSFSHWYIPPPPPPPPTHPHIKKEVLSVNLYSLSSSVFRKKLVTDRKRRSVGNTAPAALAVTTKLVLKKIVKKIIIINSTHRFVSFSLSLSLFFFFFPFLTSFKLNHTDLEMHLGFSEFDRLHHFSYRLSNCFRWRREWSTHLSHNG